MFDSVRNNKRLVQIFLLLITLPFAFWGVESYISDASGTDEVATVGNNKITQQQFQQALREQGDRMRNAMGPQFNQETMARPEVRMAVLDTLINQRLLAVHAQEAHLSVSNEQLIAMISTIPALQVDGKFSVERFEAIASAQGLTKVGLESRLRQDLATRMAVLPVAEASLVSRTGGNTWLAAALEEREVSELALKPEAYLSQVQVPADAAKNFYDSNPTKFELPEQIRFEFVVLSQKEFEQKAQISDAEVKAWYDSHQDSYKQPEERRASHILILAEKDAKPEVVKAAEAKATELLAQIKRNPSDFAKLARQHSQDPGSARDGGDLGVVTRGAMVKQFEDSVFSLKDGEISELVRTDYGFHIIRLSSLKPARIKPLADVKAQITAELKSQSAAKKYAEAAETFTNMVYEQSDSLKPVIDQFGLQTQQSPWLAKGRQVPGLSEKLLASLFSDDAIKNKRNTEAVEVAPKTLMAARVIEHKPAALVPFAQVQAEIEKRLKRDESVKLAAKDGEARLAKLNAGESVSANWSASRGVVRAGAEGFAPQSLRAIFSVSSAKLPAYVSATGADGSTVIYRINKVKAYVPGEKDDPRAAQLRQQYEQLASEADFIAWMSNLRDRYKVVINEKALLAKESKE
ncbi:MAG: SurA N-terminal domain-containing protein [Rhodocyclaceae bacterium]|nr:SurA N-terminal domain-containing protein [Rhodocyclaceae bacterium]